jgi:hypothetical protein
VVDLTAFGSSAFLGNGTVVHRNDAGWNDTYGDASHGLGDLNTFLTMSVPGSGVEQGYNTDARPVQFNEANEPAKTHSIQLSSLPRVTVNGTQYREFVLNANQRNNARNLSVDEARVFLGTTGNLTGYDSLNLTLGGQTAVWDLDAGENNTILVRSMMNQGNRAGEMVLLVPESSFAGATGDTFVYLYTKMGGTAGATANGGADQWGYRLPPISQPPTESGKLSGYVYVVNDGWTPGDSSFTPVEGVTINLFDINTGNLVATTTTDVNGLFQFENLAAGNYVMVQDFDEPSQFPALQDYQAFAQESGTVVGPDEILVDLASDQVIGGFYFTETIAGS